MITDVSIWLIPKKEQELSLRKTIDNLAQKYGAFSFIPHITVYHLANSMNPNEVIKVVEEETSTTKFFTLEAEEIRHSNIFTKTLYVQYKINDSLQKLYQRLRTRFQNIHDYNLSPHLSLIYKNNMANEDKEKEIAQITYPKILEIDRIMVITKKGITITKEEDVLDWTVAFEKKLTN